jgi:antitoxin ParD1/3/4
MATMNISLPDEMKAFIEGQVESGLYANASDFVRDAIRDRMWTPEALLAALEAGEASGLSDLGPRQIFDEFLANNP